MISLLENTAREDMKALNKARQVEKLTRDGVDAEMIATSSGGKDGRYHETG